jgi:hypothetical protein
MLCSTDLVATRCRSANSRDVLATAHATSSRFAEDGSQIWRQRPQCRCARAARRAACCRLTQSSVAITFDLFAPRSPREVRRTVRDYCALPAETPCCTHSRHSSGDVQESLIWRMELKHYDVTSLTPMLPSPHHTHAGTIVPRAAMLPLPAPSCSAYTEQSDWRAPCAVHYARSPQHHFNPSARRIRRPLSSTPQPTSLFALQIPRTMALQLLQPSQTSKLRGYQKIGSVASSGYGLVLMGK